MNNASFDKGEKFEKFVLDHLFQATHYDLVHQTNPTSQNQYRFVENSLKPDFKFRCKRTRCEFYVEAKYRSDFNRYDDKIEIMRGDQFERYHAIQEKEQIPVFVVVGYQGYASNPLHVSLISLTQLQYLEAYPSFLQKFAIPKLNVSSYNLNLRVDVENIAWVRPKRLQNKKLTLQPSAPGRSKNIVWKYAMGVVIALCLALFGMHSYNEAKIDKTLQQRTAAYYEVLDSGVVDDLDEYVNPTVDKWYYKKNLTLEEVKDEARYYLNKYKKTKTDIHWETFEVKPLGDDYLVTFNMHYQIFSKRLKNKIYHLQIKAVWGGNLKLKSMYEIKLQ